MCVCFADVWRPYLQAAYLSLPITKDFVERNVFLFVYMLLVFVRIHLCERSSGFGRVLAFMVGNISKRSFLFFMQQWCNIRAACSLVCVP